MPFQEGGPRGTTDGKSTVGQSREDPIFYANWYGFDVGRSQVKRYIRIFIVWPLELCILKLYNPWIWILLCKYSAIFVIGVTSIQRLLYCDNGGNFFAAAQLLKNELNWCFSPPRASHQGGFYEVFCKLFWKVFWSIAGDCMLNEFDFQQLTNHYVAKLSE